MRISKAAAVTIEKTDAHHHLWWLNSPHYPMLRTPAVERYFGNTGGLRHDFGAAQFLPLAAAANVTRSVYVESHFDPPVQESVFVQAFADEHGFPHAIVGRVDLAAPDLNQLLDIHQRSALFRGVRAIVTWDEDPQFRGTAEPELMMRTAWRQGYAELGRRGLSAEVMVTPAQLIQLAELAAALPSTPLVVGHAGLPLRRTPQEHDQWIAGMAALAAIPHVVVKISGLAMVDHQWTVERIEPIVRQLINLFTPSRCMFASNFPVDGLHSSYAAVWDAFEAITAGDAEADRTSLFSGTAGRFYRID